MSYVQLERVLQNIRVVRVGIYTLLQNREFDGDNLNTS